MQLDLSGLTRRASHGSGFNQQRAATLTDLPKLSPSNIHELTSVRVKDERTGKGKDGFKRVDNSVAGFAGKVRAKTLAAEHLERVPITRTSISVEDYDFYDEDMKKIANAYQAHIDPVDHSDTMTEKKLWTMMTTRKTTRFLRMLLWTMLLFSRQLNRTRLLFSLIHGTMILIPK